MLCAREGWHGRRFATTSHFAARLSTSSPFLQTVQQWIEGSEADSIAVLRQFFSHAKAEDWAFGGMVQDVQTYDPGTEIPVHGAICRPGLLLNSITNFGMDKPHEFYYLGISPNPLMTSS